MVDYRRELRSRYGSLSRLYEDLRGTAFARMDWDAEVLARRTLGSDDRIENMLGSSRRLDAVIEDRDPGITGRVPR